MRLRFSSVSCTFLAVKLFQSVIVVDDENEEIEGNLVMAASYANPQAVAFLLKHGSGIVSVGMKSDDLERLQLPLMSPENEDDSSAPSFTITVVWQHFYIYFSSLTAILLGFHFTRR